MSANKRKYFKVTSTIIVSATSKTEAVAALSGRPSEADVLGSYYTVERISAGDAREVLEDSASQATFSVGV